MKTCLVTTTINVPTVLALYQKFSPGTALAVFDQEDTAEGGEVVRGARHPLSHSENAGMTLYPKFSELLGWNCVARRNIGYPSVRC